MYVEGHRNKVADTLSHYYKSSSDEDLHYDDFISADICLDKQGDDLPLSQVEEAEEMLYLHSLLFKLASMGHKSDHNLEAKSLNPPNDHLGRSKLTLADLMTPKENLHVSVKEQGFLNSIRSGLAKSTSWQGVMESPAQFPKFEVENDLIFKLNDLGE